jgi:ubiquinone/menaquinone biosynthesis C-methylase UbiE
MIKGTNKFFFTSSKEVYDKLDPESYDKRYKEIQREIYTREHWRPIIATAIAYYCKGMTVLDLGCGYGRYVGLIKENAKRVVGLDDSRKWLDYAKDKYPDVEFVLGNAHHILLQDKFDCVVSIGLFEYVDREVVVAEINKLLKQKGYLIVQVPNKYSSVRILTKAFHKISRKKNYTSEPSRKQMLALFHRHKFELIEYRADDGLIWLPEIIDRWMGGRTYRFVEKFFKFFGNNPFSANMLFIVRKIS